MKSGLKGWMEERLDARTQGCTPYRDEKRTERQCSVYAPNHYPRVALPTAMKSGLKGVPRNRSQVKDSGCTPYRDEKRTERSIHSVMSCSLVRVTLPTAMKSGLKDTRRLASLRICSKSIPQFTVNTTTAGANSSSSTPCPASTNF